MAVLDASAALDLLLQTPRGLNNIDRVFASELHAPHLLDVECAHVLRRLTFIGQIAPDRAKLTIGLLSNLRLIRHSHFTLLDRIWELRNSLSAYDAAYIALCEALGMPLFTCDAKLAHSQGHFAKIVLLN